jgi:hypothetical protein
MTTTTTPTTRKTLTLKQSGLTVTYPPTYSVDDAIAAQAAAQKAKDTAKFALYLVQRTCLFDGRQMTVGEIRQRVTGADYLKLVGELLGDDAEADEGGAGND